jgi:hypothetical protein
MQLMVGTSAKSYHRAHKNTSVFVNFPFQGGVYSIDS